jgi:phage terminase large subunit-like protein
LAARSSKAHASRGTIGSSTTYPITDQHPHVAAAILYASQVIEGRIPACKYVVRACKRFQRDLERQCTASFPYRFDPAKAERPCRFIELLPHTKGKWAAQHELIKLEPWQSLVVVNLFGWLRVGSGAKRWADMERRGTLADFRSANPTALPTDLDTRRFRRCYIEVPRKNAKSTLAAGIGLYMLAADGEEGAEVYCGATTQDQAWEVFKPARLMAERSGMKARFGIDVNASNINILRSASKFEPIIGNPGDGASPSMSITDEYHEHKTSTQYDTMVTGMGAREQPLAFVITTAGDNTSGPCFDMRSGLIRVLNAVSDEETFFGVIYTIDDGDKWEDPKVLQKANPNYGVSVLEEFLLEAQKEALGNLRSRARFLTKNLNKWIQAAAGYFDMSAWQRCEDKSLSIHDLKGHRAWFSLDLSSKIDIAALEVLIEIEENVLAVFSYLYLPEETVQKPENKHYQQFLDAGEIIQTDGNIIDYAIIEEKIIELALLLDCQDIAYDPFQATYLITRLMDEGLPCTEFRAVVLNFSEPMKQTDAWIRQMKPGGKRLVHNGNACMTWQMGNVVARLDAKDNVYPRKEREEAKIDGPVALIAAVGRYMVSDVGSDEHAPGTTFLW